MKNVRRSVLPCLLAFGAALVLGCGGDSGGGGGSPTNPGSNYPSVLGSYSSSSFYTAQLRRLSDGATASGTCSGSMTLNSQVSNSFSGAFNYNCGGIIRSGTVAGTVRVDGGVTMNLTVPGSDPDTFTALTGCVKVSGDTALIGVINASSMSASGIAVIDCPPPDGRLSASVQLYGARS